MKLLYWYIIVHNLVLVRNRISDANLQEKEKEKEKEEDEEEADHYTNTWIVCLKGGFHEAQMIATQFGFDSRVEVSEALSDFYLFRHSKHEVRMTSPDNSLTKKLRKHPKVKWAQQQIARKLIPTISVPFARKIQSILNWNTSVEVEVSSKKIDSGSKALNMCLHLTDEYWSRQFYIQDCRDKSSHKSPRDLNVTPTWIKHRLFGKNIKVIVVDDGVEFDHPDLVDNYDSKLGLDLQDNDNKPYPVHSWGRTYSHGTRCAGVIAMKANNSICGAGIAPSITFGAVRLVGPKLLDEFETGKALVFKYNEIDISSNSWRMRDNGKSVWFNGLYSLASVKVAITKGRKGKGLIFVFACGTRKAAGENCGLDPLRNCIYTISVASSDHRGKVTTFSERCASIMVTTYSGNGLPFGYNVIATDVGGGCTVNHSGTSASAPMVSGAIALALEANSNLSWRDIQHLLAWTSQMAPLKNNPPGTWIKNGAGFYVSHDFGFGMLDVNELIETAKGFQSVPPLNICVTKAKLWKDKQYFRTGLKINMMTDSCRGYPSEVVYLEHVQVTLSLAYPRRGDLQIELTSPSGTKAILLEQRPFDSYAHGIPAWTFSSVMTWGENPKGTWTVCIKGKVVELGFSIGKMVKSMWSTLKNATGLMVNNVDTDVADTENDKSEEGEYAGELKELYLIFYGTSGKSKPHHYEEPRFYHNVNSTYS